MMSLDELCEKHYAIVYKRAKFLTHDADTALEVTQEVFLRMTRHYSDLREDSNVTAWLWSVTTNLVRDMRKKRTLHMVSAEELTYTTEGKINESWHPVTDPDTQFDILLDKETWQAFLRDMEAADLTKRQRLCVKARLAGYGSDEIAASTGVTRWAVSMCLKRGAARMREYRERHERAS